MGLPFVPLYCKDDSFQSNLSNLANNSDLVDEEREDFQRVCRSYHEKQLSQFKETYGMTDEMMASLVAEFKTIYKKITSLIADETQRVQYEKFLETYPKMFFDVIPREIIEIRLSAKSIEDNKKIRDNFQKLAALTVQSNQVMVEIMEVCGGLSPLCKLISESLPNPSNIEADGGAAKFTEIKSAVDTFTHVLDWAKRKNLEDDFISKPIKFLDEHHKSVGNVEKEKVEILKSVIGEMRKGGCVPTKGPHFGPEPTMDPTSCSGNGLRIGNADHEVGKHCVYKSEIDDRGQARWVLKGKVPTMGSTFGFQ